MNPSGSSSSSSGDGSGSAESSSPGVFEDWLLTWVYPVVLKGYDRGGDRIEEKIDVSNENNMKTKGSRHTSCYSTFLPSHLRCDVVGEMASGLWEEEKRAAVEKKDPPSLLRVVLKMIRWELLFGTFFGVLQGLFATVARPLLLKYAVEAIVDDDDDGEGGGSRLWYLIIGLGIEQLVEGLCATLSRHALLDHASSTFFATCAYLVHVKSARVSTNGSKMSESALIGNDIIRTKENLKYMQLLPNSLSSLIGGVIVLYFVTGYAGLIGLSMSAVMLFFNGYIATLAKDAEEANLAAADKRLSIMKQIINGIKAIKLSAWEESFENVIRRARIEECAPLYRFRFLLQTSVQLGRSSPIIAACVCFIVQTTVFDEQLHASDTFAALNVFLSLRLALIIIPESVTYFAAASVSLSRLQKFLATPNAPASCDASFGSNAVPRTKSGLSLRWPGESKNEEDPPMVSKQSRGAKGTTTSSRRPSRAATVALEMTTKPAVSVKKYSSPFTIRMSTSGDTFVVPGRRIAVVGAVGSGKTALLLALLGEMSGDDAHRAMLRRSKDRTFGYCPQHSYVMSGSIRSNILMGRDFDAQRYRAALERTTLGKDLDQFPRRDMTLVGERGVTLSGGQKSRLGLARAIYSDPEVLILDDPLSAVDSVVAKKIFERTVMSSAKIAIGGVENEDGLKKTRTIVMALNQLHLCPYFDEVVVLRGGRVIERGDPRELAQRKGSDFSTMVVGCEEDRTDHAAATTTTASKTSCEDNEDREDKTNAGHDTNKLVKDQHVDSGQFSHHIFWTYIQGMGRARSFCAVLATMFTYGVMTWTDRWLAWWVNYEEDHPNEETYPLRFPVVYAFSCVAFVALLVISSQMFARAGVRASKHLHEQCVGRLLRAPVSFFNATPSGRIMSRFSSDLSMTDLNVPRFFDNFTQFAATLLALVVMVCVLVPLMIPIFLAALVFFGVECTYVNNATRCVKRECNNAMSPVLTITSDAAAGRAVVRSLGAASTIFFDSKFRKAVDQWNEHSYVALSITTWAQVVSYLLSFCISVSTAVFIVVRKDSYNGSTAALAMTYAFLIPYFLLHMVFIIGQLNIALTSLERLLRYAGDGVPQEPAWRRPDDPSPSAFPTHGTIVFDRASLRYRKGLPLSLRDVSFTFEGGSRIGCVGRTGAGKSSLLVLLFRIVDACNGRVSVDGVDVKKLGLLSLRQSMAVVPQVSLLIQGSVRTNLDPFGSHSDAELRDVMRQVGLSVNKLNDEDDAASSLSAGERQMMSLARALLSRRKIVVCDEPTSNVDMASDRKIQDVLRHALARRKCTVITIAHRLQTVVDHDKILVMDSGKVAEFDTPTALLSDSRTILYAMAMSAGGPRMVAELLKLAKK
eukprot:g360.t1